MTSNVKKFARTSIVYFFGKALTLIVTVLMLPIYTSKISPDGYGQFEVIKSLSAIILPFFCMEMWFGMLRLSFTEKYLDNKRILFSTSFFFISGICVLIGGGFGIAYAINHQSNMLFAIGLIFSEALTFVCTHISRSYEKDFLYSISGIISSVVNASVGILCVYLFHMQEGAMFLATIMGNLSQILIIFFVLKVWREIGFKYCKWDALKDLSIYCWPFALYAIVAYLSADFNKLLISWYASPASVGYYTVGMKFVSIIVTLAGIVRMAWMEVVFKTNDEAERKSMITSWTNKAMMLFVILALAGLVVVKIFFPILIDEQYNDAMSIMPYLYFSSFFILSNDMMVNSAKSENKNWINLICQTVSTVVNITLFLSLIHFADLYAPCIAYSLAAVALYISLIICNRYFLNIKYDFRPSILFAILFPLFGYSFLKWDLEFNLFLTILLLIFACFYLKNIFEPVMKKINPNFGNNIKAMFENKKSKILYIVMASLIAANFFFSYFLYVGVSKYLQDGQLPILITFAVLLGLSFIATIAFTIVYRQDLLNILKTFPLFFTYGLPFASLLVGHSMFVVGSNFSNYLDLIKGNVWALLVIVGLMVTNVIVMHFVKNKVVINKDTTSVVNERGDNND